MIRMQKTKQDWEGFLELIKERAFFHGGDYYIVVQRNFYSQIIFGLVADGIIQKIGRLSQVIEINERKYIPYICGISGVTTTYKVLKQEGFISKGLDLELLAWTQDSDVCIFCGGKIDCKKLNFRDPCCPCCGERIIPIEDFGGIVECVACGHKNSVPEEDLLSDYLYCESCGAEI